MCDLQQELVIAPLPAKKQLWEASDEIAWKVEKNRKRVVWPSFGLTSKSELVKLNEDELNCHDAVLTPHILDGKVTSRSTANWEEWCSGMDGFGALIMLAASLL